MNYMHWEFELESNEIHLNYCPPHLFLKIILNEQDLYQRTIIINEIYNHITINLAKDSAKF